MKYALPLLVLGAVGFSPSAFAERMLELPPVHVQTVHGGVHGSPPIACVTADMGLNASHYITPGPGAATGVSLGYHAHNFSFRNVSTVNQTVTVLVGAGSRMRSAVSTGINGIPNQPSGGVTVPGEVPIQFVMPPGDARAVAIYTFCNINGSCWSSFEIQDAGGNALGAGSVAGGAGSMGLGTGIACLALDSTFQFKIRVLENRGAVTANFTTSYHRGGGLTDKAVSNIPSYPVNGGRPF